MAGKDFCCGKAIITAGDSSLSARLLKYGQEAYADLKKEQGISDQAFYHYDTPLLVEHEMDILRRAGFRDVRILKQWGESTYTVLAAV